MLSRDENAERREMRKDPKEIEKLNLGEENNLEADRKLEEFKRLDCNK